MQAQESIPEGCYGCVRMIVLWVKYGSLLFQLVVIWILYWLRTKQNKTKAQERKSPKKFLGGEENHSKRRIFPPHLLEFDQFLGGKLGIK